MAGPTLTPNLTENPWVEVFFDPGDLHPDTVTMRVYRYSEGRTWLTRGGVDITPGQAVLDFEVPFQTQSTYRAAQFDADGLPLGFTDPSSITVDYTGTVVHQPLAPSTLWAPVRVLHGSAAELVRPEPGDVVDIEGGTVGRWIGTGRRGLRGVPVSLLAESLDAADRVQAMLGDYTTRQVGVLCIRTSDRIRWPRTFFARGDLTEFDLTDEDDVLVQFTASADEVEPPFPGLVRPLLTYADLDAAFPSYADRDAEFGTYTTQDRAYEYAGFADGGA